MRNLLTQFLNKFHLFCLQVRTSDMERVRVRFCGLGVLAVQNGMHLESFVRILLEMQVRLLLMGIPLIVQQSRGCMRGRRSSSWRLRYAII